jgi:hypothetical protein
MKTPFLAACADNVILALLAENRYKTNYKPGKKYGKCSILQLMADVKRNKEIAQHFQLTKRI